MFIMGALTMVAPSPKIPSPYVSTSDNCLLSHFSDGTQNVHLEYYQQTDDCWEAHICGWLP